MRTTISGIQEMTALPGRRLDFTSVQEFQHHYGDELDRFGGESGSYLSMPNSTFEERALPPGSLRQPYLTMRLTGDMPANFKIEVSEVAPAFGQRGGGLQVRILDADGQALTVEKLKNQGIIELTDNSHWPRDWPRPGGSAVLHHGGLHYGGPRYGGWSNGPSE